MAFLTPGGALVPVRCKSPNKCSHCAFLSAAATVKAHTAPADFRRDIEQLFKALRRRCPEAEYLGRIEFTTGKGKNSAGQRREGARAAPQDRRAERRFFELLDAQGLTPYDLGPDWDEILEEELERVRLERECTTLVHVQRVPTEFGPDGLPAAWADEVWDSWPASDDGVAYRLAWVAHVLPRAVVGRIVLA